MDNLVIQIFGEIQNSNFPTWKNALLKQIAGINLELATDNDFAVATDNAKFLKRAEKAVQEAKIRAIEQTEEIQKLFNALDEISEQARQARLMLERKIKTRKQKIKEDLINSAIKEIIDYINDKSDIFSQLDNSRYVQRHQYEAIIKSKSSLTGVNNALALFVRDLKNAIDNDCSRVLSNYKLLEAIPSNHTLLFQDVSYLVTLPESQLKLTIENRTAKLSEQRSRLAAERAENELSNIANEELFGIINEDEGRYLITIEMLSTRHYAINKAKEIKSIFDNSKSLIGMKLSKYK